HPVSGLADRRRIGTARFRRGLELRPGGAGRNAAADHRAAEPGAARGAREQRGAKAPAPGGRRADADNPGGARGRDRPRGDQMVGAHQVERAETGMIIVRPSMKLILAVTTFALAVLGAAAPAGAQDYPSRPITLIVPYAAGGGNDLMARVAAEKMSKTLG